MAFVEQTDRRGRGLRVERDDATGLFRALVSIHDQHVQEAGQWVAVEEGFDLDGQNGYALKAKPRLRHALRLANDGGRLGPHRRD
jgi:hypothetical protein